MRKGGDSVDCLGKCPTEGFDMYLVRGKTGRKESLGRR